MRVGSLVLMAAAAAAELGSKQVESRLRGGSTGPMQLVSGSGELISSSAKAVSDAAGSSLSLIASVGGKSRGSKLLNALFGTKFDTSFQLDGPSIENGGAWLESSPSMSGCMVLESRPLPSDGQQRSAADACKLACFSLVLADVLIVHAPCVTPSSALVTQTYERLFSHYLSATPGGSNERTLLVYVADPAGEMSAAEIHAACKSAWETAAATTEIRGKGFSDLFELEVVFIPSETEDAQAFLSGIDELRIKLSGAGGKLGKTASFVGAATSAWEAAGAALDGEPSEQWLTDRYLAARSYETAYADAQVILRRWIPQVAKGKIIKGFGADASALLTSALDSFDAGVRTCSATSSAMLTQRRARLAKALQNDVQELFSKQHRQLTTSTMNRYKAQLIKVMGRGGTVADWQQEGLRRDAEKHFDAVVGQLIVDGVGDSSRAQLTTSFGKQLTEMTAKYLDSPPMQLQAIGAMRRRTGKGQKPPRGIRAGIGLVGAVRNTFGGGQGNIQTYAGYVDGLNSVHVMFANDGAVVDSSGAEPPPFRWQPKMNFDVSI